VDVVKDIQRKLQPVVTRCRRDILLQYTCQFEDVNQYASASDRGIVSRFFTVGVFLVSYTMFRKHPFVVAGDDGVTDGRSSSFGRRVGRHRANVDDRRHVGSFRWPASAFAKRHPVANHYCTWSNTKGEGWTQEMIVRAGLDGLGPVLMTAVGRRNRAWSPFGASRRGKPGKEILYPVAGR